MTTKGSSNNLASKKRVPKPLRIALKLGISLLIAIVLNIAITSFTESPKMSKMHEEQHLIREKFSLLQKKIASAQHTIDEIILRDHQIYRPLLDIDTLDIPEVYAEYNNSKYASLAYDELYGNDIKRAWLNIDQLSRSMYYASRSLDETQTLADNKQEYTMVIPAIWPIDRTKLRYISSLYGPRVHPKFGYGRMHEGIDLAAPHGTDVYATGDAVVTRANWQRGYGNIIELNHGFGYRTRYAHLQKVFVKSGDSVSRGALIGTVGSTGVSTGPHLHYEVHFRGNHVDPINYFNKDIDTASYRNLMNQLTHDNSQSND